MQKEKFSVTDMIIDEIENSSTNDWDELCNDCSSLIKKAGMTSADINRIAKNVRSRNV